MKKYRLSMLPLLFLMTAALLQSCSGKIDRTGFMPPVKIQIPEDAKADKATVEFVKSSEILINALSDKIEDIATNGKELLAKKDQDMTLMDNLKMTKLSVQFLSAGKSLTDELTKVQQYIEQKQKEGVSEADMKVYEAVEKTLENRINQLNKKYKDLVIQ